jgi:hypothetical protein
MMHLVHSLGGNVSAEQKARNLAAERLLDDNPLLLLVGCEGLGFEVQEGFGLGFKGQEGS